MERLEFGDEFEYNATEGAIHLTRYSLARDLCKDKNVLDIACGEGYGSYFMSIWGAKHVEAVDISQEAIDKASRRFRAENINYICHQAQQLDYQDSTFDLVVSLETIEHLDNPEEFLKEIRRVLKPDGTLIISCPNDAYFINVGGSLENPYHKKRYTFEEFGGMVESYFGGNCDYYLGYALGGFVNLPINKCNGHEQFKMQNPFQMFQYKEGNNFFEIPSHQLLNTENCSYYVGVFGKKVHTIDSAVFFANDQCNQQYGIELMNKTQRLELLKIEYSKLQKCYSELQNKYSEKNIIDKEQELDKKNIEIDRLKVALQLSEKEKNIISESVKWEDASKYRIELENIYNSRTFRYLRGAYKFREKLQHLFKR